MHINMLQLYYFRCTASFEYSSHPFTSLLCNLYIYRKQANWLVMKMNANWQSFININLTLPCLHKRFYNIENIKLKNIKIRKLNIKLAMNVKWQIVIFFISNNCSHLTNWIYSKFHKIFIFHPFEIKLNDLTFWMQILPTKLMTCEKI